MGRVAELGSFCQKMSDPSKCTKRWKQASIILTIALLAAFAGLGCIAFLATQSLTTHYNLYYLMWKAGLRPYDSIVARSGMIHDLSFRDSLNGISIEEFEKVFPSTFHEVTTLPPIAKPDQRFFIDDYHQSKNEAGGFRMVWLAIFENGKLIELEFSKG